jgi:membrane protease YdiL (CAAX protease family)
MLMSRLERRHNIYAGAVFSAIPFALAHVPLVFFLGERAAP